jgi:hypothetical protein
LSLNQKIHERNKIHHESDKSNFEGESNKATKEYHKTHVPTLSTSLNMKSPKIVVHEHEFESSPGKVQSESMKDYLESHISDVSLGLYREDQEKKLLKA